MSKYTMKKLYYKITVSAFAVDVERKSLRLKSKKFFFYPDVTMND